MVYSSSLSTGPADDRPPHPRPRRAEPGRWPKLEAALTLVNRDVTATLPGQEALVLVVLPQPLPHNGRGQEPVYVAMPDGRWHGNAVNAYDVEAGDPPEPDDPATVLTLVADAAQETVTELLWQAWPVCSAHGLGLHPRPAGTGEDWQPDGTDPAGPPVWWCRGGGTGTCHDVCLVGELAAR